ncbi:VOC family protein, partial [Hungatella sp.]
MKPKIDHIHVTVADIKRAEAFYDQLLPILGFDLSLKEHDTVPEHEYQIVEYHNQEFSFGIVNQRSQYEGDRVSRRRAGALHHLAFHVDSRAEVDAVFARVSAIPAVIV